MSVVLPKVFEETAEDSKFLIRVKRRAAKEFKWTRRICLENVLFLAHWLCIFERTEEALEVCRFLAQSQFNGKLDHWWYIQGALVLQSRILKAQELQQEADDCLNRVRSVGDDTYRFDGMVLRRYEQDVNNALDLSSRGLAHLGRLSEICGRMMIVIETSFLLEMNSSPALSMTVLEEELAANLRHLRTLAGK